MSKKWNCLRWKLSKKNLLSNTNEFLFVQNIITQKINRLAGVSITGYLQEILGKLLPPVSVVWLSRQRTLLTDNNYIIKCNSLLGTDIYQAKACIKSHAFSWYLTPENKIENIRRLLTSNILDNSNEPTLNVPREENLFKNKGQAILFLLNFNDFFNMLRLKIYNRRTSKPASRSSIWISMNVMLTPATANGYSHTDRSPSCFRKRSWKDFYKMQSLSSMIKRQE